MPIELKVYVNSDDAFLCWRAKAPIEGCRGFALHRKRNGKQEVVPSYVGFEGDDTESGEHRSTEEWPIQKFIWTDYLAKAGDKVSYRVVPMVGEAGELEPLESEASKWTATVAIENPVEGKISAFFNRGIVASQWVSRSLGAAGKKIIETKLRDSIETIGDRTRDYLGGELKAQILSMLDDYARNKGHIYAALYELSDPELIDGILAFKKRAHVVLANGSVKKSGEDQNSDARSQIEGKVDLHNRMCSPKRLGHNKFVVFCDSQNLPKQVLTGSTNWTPTGLCTQANNGLVITDSKVAKQYLEHWAVLSDAGDDLTQDLLDDNDKVRKISLSGTKGSLWFTAVSEQQDLEEAKAVISAAKKGVLFLMFNPGPRGTLLNAILEKRDEDEDLYVQGVVNQNPGTEKNPVELFHRGTRAKANYEIVLPEAIDEATAFWRDEVKKLPRTFAMVHSKVIVVDPFSPSCAVMTGSHNLGPKASGTNDENLLILKGNSELAQAYAVNIMSIYNQYRWRFFRLKSEKSKSWLGLKNNDTWQKGYFTDAKKAEIDFWSGK